MAQQLKDTWIFNIDWHLVWFLYRKYHNSQLCRQLHIERGSMVLVLSQWEPEEGVWWFPGILHWQHLSLWVSLYPTMSSAHGMARGCVYLEVFAFTWRGGRCVGVCVWGVCGVCVGWGGRGGGALTALMLCLTGVMRLKEKSWYVFTGIITGYIVNCSYSWIRHWQSKTTKTLCRKTKPAAIRYCTKYYKM